MKLLTKYKNGNYEVRLFDDGTKFRICSEDQFKPEFPESIDMKISNRCSFGCPYCHENSTREGKIADFKKAEPFLATLHAGTEIALGGGALSEVQPDDLLHFVHLLEDYGCIVNMTINGNELDMPNFINFISLMCPTKGIGVSFIPDENIKEKLLKFKNEYTHISLVVHTIAGVTKKEDYDWLLENGSSL